MESSRSWTSWSWNAPRQFYPKTPETQLNRRDSSITMKHLLLTTIAAVVLTTTAFADPIHDAAEEGDLAGVQAELDKGVDVNAKAILGLIELPKLVQSFR